jgi:hypothetical protein
MARLHRMKLNPWLPAKGSEGGRAALTKFFYASWPAFGFQYTSGLAFCNDINAWIWRTPRERNIFEHALCGE